MRTAFEDAQDIATVIDQLLVENFNCRPGIYLDVVMKSFDESLDSRLAYVSELNIKDAGAELGENISLWAAHYLANAKKLSLKGREIEAYQELLAAMLRFGELKTYFVAMSMAASKKSSMKNAQAFRHLVTKDIEAFAVKLFRSGGFPSAHKASIELVEQVRNYAAEKGKPMSEDRASKTIYEWLLRSMKGKH